MRLDIFSSFYFLSKFIPYFVMPLGISILLLISYLIWKKKWNFKLAIFILCFFSIGLVTDLLWFLVEFKWYSFDPMNIDNADAIVVLSGENSPINSRYKEIKKRFRLSNGIDLFYKKKAPFIIFTSSFNPYNSKKFSEGEFNKMEAIKLGINEDSILLTQRVRHTIEEAKEVKRLINIDQKSRNKIILVTSAFHMHRAKKIFEKQNLRVIPFPVDFYSRRFKNKNRFNNPSYWIPNANKLSNSSKALREIVGIIFYTVF